jgi:hypothetical protein
VDWPIWLACSPMDSFLARMLHDNVMLEARARVPHFYATAAWLHGLLAPCVSRCTTTGPSSQHIGYSRPARQQHMCACQRRCTLPQGASQGVWRLVCEARAPLFNHASCAADSLKWREPHGDVAGHALSTAMPLAGAVSPGRAPHVHAAHGR